MHVIACMSISTKSAILCASSTLHIHIAKDQKILLTWRTLCKSNVIALEKIKTKMFLSPSRHDLCPEKHTQAVESRDYNSETGSSVPPHKKLPTTK